MTSIELCRNVVEHKSARLYRPRKGESGQYDSKPLFAGSDKGWVLLDLFTASAILTVFDALSEKNQHTFASMPLPKAVEVSFKVLKSVERRG